MEAPKFITAKEAAYQLRIHLNHLYICMREGRGPPFIKAMGVIRIPYDGFQQWIANGGGPGKTNGHRGAPGKRDPRKNHRKKDKPPCTA